ncbi:MAG: InlB B-repeat-containing protein [Paludibacteraceae bacterium]|nr:InlB B-repeat-containing protein [Paludibacteraceae bacterium]
MKRLSLFFAALFVAVSMSAEVIEGPIAGTLAGGTPVLNTGFAAANTRGGFGVKDDGVYFVNYATGHLSKADLQLSAIAAEADSTGVGYYMDIDKGGNFIIWAWTVGSSTLDVAQVYNANHQLIRNDSLAIKARCDMPGVAGNLVSGRGAYIVASNSVKFVQRFNFVDGVQTSVDSIPVPITLAGNNSVSAIDVDHFYVQSRGNGLLYIDCSGAEPVVTAVKPEIFGVNTFTSAYGGAAFELCGHKLYVMGTYKVGQYGGSFAVFDVTDPANPYQIADDPTNIGTSTMGTAHVGMRVVVEDDTAHIYEYARYNARTYDLTVAPACFIKQGNTGAEWTAMTASNGTFTYEGIYMADSLFINGTAADEGATKFTRAGMTYQGTVAVNDTVRFTYDPTATSMTVTLLGQFVPVINFSVKVPAGTPNCYVVGTFNNWASFERMRQITDSTYAYTYRGFAALQENVQYKYTCGTDWAYVEKGAQGEEIANRTWAENDVVLSWASVPVINKITYVLNGGVTNDYGWTSKGAVCVDLMNDFNATYNTSKAWAKAEDGQYFYKIGENWMLEDDAAGQVCTVAGFIQNVTYNTSDQLKNLITVTMADKYSWLKDIIAHTRAAAEMAAGDADLVENIYRKEVSAIFLESPAEVNWPAAPSYAIAGTDGAILPIWKHAFANPETVNHTFVLNAPYKEGFTFDGWYADSTFTGSKIVSINDSTPTCTLYAKWIEYIQTIQEAIASDSLANVKTAGTVNFVDGKQVYIQDATAAVLVYMKAAQNVVPGDYIVVTGKNVIYNGAPEISDGEIKSTESGHPLNPENTATLAALKADMLKYFGKRIKIDGLVIASYDSKGNTYVTDGVDTVECYKVVLNQTTFPVGTRVNIRLIGGAYKGAFQFVGPTDGIELAPLSGRDNYVYPARGESGEYTLTNKWLICEKLENYSANRPAGTNFCRGMAAKDGKMYFVNRENGSFTVVDGATGEMLDPLMITGDHLFQAQDSTGEWKDCVTLKFNDVKFDNAGNCLVTACASGAQRVMVYKVDLTTGAATEVINERLYDNPDFYIDEENKDSWRMDAIGVYGDVNNHAIVMFGNSMNADLHAAYMWEINNGVAAPAERIDLIVNAEDDTYLWKEPGVLYTENSSACQVFPVDENYFYWDHHSCRPTLFSMDGTFADDLKACPTNVVVVNNEGDTCKVGSGHNGICEFQIGEDYFVIMAATNNVENPAGSFAPFKYADAAKAFSGLEPLWFFPAGGMGTMTNAYRTAIPTVEVREDKAYIYLYTGENGYGVYEMTGVRSGLTNTKDDVKALKVVENGQVYIIRNGVRYTVLGAQVSK